MTTPTSSHWDPCRIAIWSSFDAEAFGDELAARVTAHELGRRLPAAGIVRYAPGDEARPSRLAGGEPALPLGAWTDDRAAELAAQLDLVVVTAGAIDAGSSSFLTDGLGATEHCCPVVWHAVGVAAEPDEEQAALLRKALASRAYVAVADQASKRWLEAAGVDREIAVLPHPGLLAPRLFPAGLLDKRLAYLRLMGWYPAEGGCLVVQGAGSMAPGAAGLAQVIGDAAQGRAVVLVEAGPSGGDSDSHGDLAEALATLLDGPVHRLPVAGVEDLVAAVAASSGVVAASPAVLAAAAAFHRPARPLGIDGPLVAAAPEAVRLGQAELDGSYDHLAALAGQAATRRTAPADPGELRTTVAALRRANAVQARRLVEERLTFADHTAELTEQLRRTESSLADHAGVMAGQAAAMADQERALVEHQQALLALDEALRTQTGELDRARAFFDQLQAHVQAIEARLASEAAARAAADADLAALRASRTFRYSAPVRAAAARLVASARRRPR